MIRRPFLAGLFACGALVALVSLAHVDQMVRTYREVFDELFILDAPGSGNRILIALPRKQPLSRDELTQRARKVSAAKRFPFDLGDPVKYGLLDAHAKSQHGRVLRDRDLEQRKLERHRSIR